MTPDIRSLLIKILESEFKNKVGEVATVDAVDNLLVTVTTVLSKVTYTRIRLQAQTGDGLYIVPKVGSTVVVGWMHDNTGYIAMYSSIDSIQMLDGTYGGLVKVMDLVGQLNDVENKVNALITYINTHVHPTTGSIPSPIYTGGPLTPTVRADIENTLITHGTVS